MTKPNPIAKALRTPRFAQKIVPGKHKALLGGASLAQALVKLKEMGCDVTITLAPQPDKDANS